MSKDNKAWWNSPLAKSIAGIIVVLTGSLGIYLGQPTPKKEGGGNLTKFITGDYAGYKKWASDQIGKNGEKIDAINQYINMQKGADAVRAEYRDEFRRIESEYKPPHNADVDFTREYYPFQKIVILKNIKTGNEYFDAKDGNRYRLSWQIKDGQRKYYYIDRDGNNKWCE